MKCFFYLKLETPRGDQVIASQRKCMQALAKRSRKLTQVFNLRQLASPFGQGLKKVYCKNTRCQLSQLAKWYKALRIKKYSLSELLLLKAKISYASSRNHLEDISQRLFRFFRLYKSFNNFLQIFFCFRSLFCNINLTDIFFYVLFSEKTEKAETIRVTKFKTG